MYHVQIKSKNKINRYTPIGGYTLDFINKFTKEKIDLENNIIKRDLLIYIKDLLKSRNVFGNELFDKYTPRALEIFEEYIEDVLNLSDDTDFELLPTYDF